MTTVQLTAAQLNTPASPIIDSKSVRVAVPSRHLLRRSLLHHWELISVLALLGASAITGVSLLLSLAS